MKNQLIKDLKLSGIFKKSVLSAVLTAACLSPQAFASWDNPYIPDIDDNLDEFLEKVQTSQPIRSEFALTEEGLLEAWNQGGLSTLNYEFLQGQDSTAAINLLNNQENVFERAINLRVDSESSGGAGTALAINLGLSKSASFNETVNIEVVSASVKENQTVVNIFQDAHAVFKDSLTIEADLEQNSALLKLGNSSTVTLEGPAGLNSFGQANAIALDQNSKLNVSNKLWIKAKNTIVGEGSIEVSGKDAEVLIDGDVGNSFKGKYSQESGTFVITGKVDFSKDAPSTWEFKDVSISTLSANIYNIAASDFAPEKDLLSEILVTGPSQKPFKEIELRDKTVSLDYLNAASKLYDGVQISYTGDLIIKDDVISEISLDNHYGLLENSNISLASVRLHLDDKAHLENHTIRVGAITGHEKELSLSKTDLALYGKPHENVAGDFEKLTVGAGSVLTLHGENGERRRANDVRVKLNSKIDVVDNGKLNFSGQTSVLEKGEVKNISGQVVFKENSSTLFHTNFVQEGGSTVLSKGAEVTSNKGFMIGGGSFNLEGTLNAQSASFAGTDVSISGKLSTKDLSIGSLNNAKAANVVTLSAGSDVTAETVAMSGSALQIHGDGKGNVASLATNQVSMSSAQIKIGSDGMLIVGDKSERQTAGFDRPGVVQAVQTLYGKPAAVLAINETLKLGADTCILVGGFEQKGTPANVHFGSDGVLLIRPHMEAPVFTATDNGQVISFTEGSGILVEDPFEKVQLTDTTIKEIQGSDLVNIHSANQNVDLTLQFVDGFGWTFASKTKKENFVFPELQGWIYNNENPTLDADNVALRFFARADNENYMAPEYSHALIAETTLSHSLVGTRANTFGAANHAVGVKYKIANNLLDRSEKVEFDVFGDVSSGYFVSKSREGYLKSSSYRATYENFLVGISSKNDSGYAMVATLNFSNVDSKSKHSVLDAKGKQYIFDVSAAVGKRIGRTEIKGNIGVGYSNDSVKAALPTSMDMGSMKSTARGWYVTAGAEVSYLIGYGVQVGLSPQVWHFAGNDEKTKISGEDAFNLSNDAQTMVDIPLKVFGKQELTDTSYGKISGNWEFGGSIRTGDLEKKGKLTAVGLGGKESITQKEFNRWSAFGSAGLSLKRNNMNAGLNISVATGDGKLNSMVSLEASWTF